MKLRSEMEYFYPEFSRPGIRRRFGKDNEKNVPVVNVWHAKRIDRCMILRRQPNIKIESRKNARAAGG